MADICVPHHGVDGVDGGVYEQVQRIEPSLIHNLSEKQSDDGVVYYIDEKTGDRFRKVPAGVDDDGVEQQRLLPISKNKRTNWKGKEGFLFAQKLVFYLPPWGRYQLWVVCNEDGKDTIEREMTEEDWLSMRMKSKSKLHIRCSVCTVISSTSTANNLASGQCTSCFCKGSPMRRIDQQYYECMMNPVICKATDQFTHMRDYELVGWDHNEFIRQVSKTGNETKLPLRCKTCGVFSDKSALRLLQQNIGIACFCKGSTMRLKDPQYFQCMMNPVICKATDQFAKMHKYELKWDQEEFIRQVDKTGNKTKLPLRCKTCGVLSDKTTLNSLQSNRGIACFCKGIALRYNDPQYFQCMMDPVICEATDQFMQLHNNCILEGWEQEEFIRQVSTTGKYTKLPLRCKVCGVFSDKSTLNDLQQNQGIACFCKGSKLRYTDPQYFKCMMDPVICEATDQFMQLHNNCILEGWEQEEFIRQVSTTGKYTKLPLRCKVCGVFSDKSTLGGLQQNHGFACFCKGSKMRLTNPQYYECMMDPAICKATNKFTQLHDKCVLEGWDQAEFIRHVFKTGYETRLPLRCTTCGVLSKKTALGWLQRNQGIACKCTSHKTEMKVMEWLEKIAFPMATWENNPIKFGPKSEKGGQCKFDIVGTWPSGIQIIVEVDGAQHFDLDEYHASADIIANDVTKEQWVLLPPSPPVVTAVAGLIRVLQQDAWEDLNGWEGYLRTSIDSLLLTQQQPSPTPRIVRPVAPEYLSGVYADRREQQLEYVQWKTTF